MATVALLLQPRLQQLVRKLTDRAKGLYALVITVAGNAISFRQFLMEGDVLLLLRDGQALGCLETDLCNLVTGDALGRTAS